MNKKELLIKFLEEAPDEQIEVFVKLLERQKGKHGSCVIYADWFVLTSEKLKEFEASEDRLKAMGYSLGEIVDMAIAYKKSQGYRPIGQNLKGSDFMAPPMELYGDDFDMQDKKVLLDDYDLLMLVCKYPLTFAQRIVKFNAGIEDVENRRKKAYKNHRQAIERWHFPAEDKIEKYEARVKKDVKH